MTTAIAIAPGEPAGIGPDICLQLLCEPPPCACVLIADEKVLRARAQALNLACDLPRWNATCAEKGYFILPVEAPYPVQAGILNVGNAAYVLSALNQAVRGCMDGEFDALVTGPVHKGLINDAGTPFSGHTEYLAQLSNTNQVVMMLQAHDLRVALLTTHVPLAEVSQQITPTRLKHVILTLVDSLRARFGLAKPRVLICGLNPHAGEGGHLGREEIDIMIPSLEALKRDRPDLVLIGPVPADTAFAPDQLAQCDVVLAMYHDQGLPVLKHHGFGHAVNVTLGLPFVRTSVDHGTALEIAGTGRAHAGSLREALRVAYDAVKR